MSLLAALMMFLTFAALLALAVLWFLAATGRVLVRVDLATGRVESGRFARRVPTQRDPDAEEDGLWPPTNRSDEAGEDR